MGILYWIVTYGCKLGLRIAYKVDAAEMKKIRRSGPLILFTNHRGTVEAPMVYTHLQPRPKVTALSKVENWDKPFLGFVFNLWKIIPIRRGEVDLEAMRTLLDSLKDGWILGIAPEGTRNRTGELIQAQAGIAVLAQKSGAPLQPLAHWVDKPARRFLGFFPRPVFHIRVGEPFRLAPSKGRVSKDDRQEIADQIMYQLARLLPEKMRGVYASPSEAPHSKLVFEAEK